MDLKKSTIFYNKFLNAIIRENLLKELQSLTTAHLPVSVARKIVSHVYAKSNPQYTKKIQSLWKVHHEKILKHLQVKKKSMETVIPAFEVEKNNMYHQELIDAICKNKEIYGKFSKTNASSTINMDEAKTLYSLMYPEKKSISTAACNKIINVWSKNRDQLVNMLRKKKSRENNSDDSSEDEGIGEARNNKRVLTNKNLMNKKPVKEVKKAEKAESTSGLQKKLGNKGKKNEAVSKTRYVETEESESEDEVTEEPNQDNSSEGLETVESASEDEDINESRNRKIIGNKGKHSKTLFKMSKKDEKGEGTSNLQKKTENMGKKNKTAATIQHEDADDSYFENSSNGEGTTESSSETASQDEETE